MLHLKTRADESKRHRGKLYKSPLRRRLRKVRTTARAPIAINTQALVIHAGYNCLGGAKDAVRKKNGFRYIGIRMLSGIWYQPPPVATAWPRCADSRIAKRTKKRIAVTTLMAITVA